MKCTRISGIKNYGWIWITIDRYGKRFINFVLGDRSAGTGQKLWDALKDKAIGKVETLRDELEVQEHLLSLERKLFAITEAKYQNHEITPTQFIQEEIAFRQKEWKHEKHQEKLIRQEDRLRQYYDQ